QIWPLRRCVSPAVSTACTLNSFATRASSVTLLIMVARSLLAMPKVICGCWSMNTMAESAGVYSLWYWFMLLFPFYVLDLFSHLLHQLLFLLIPSAAFSISFATAFGCDILTAC